MRIQDPLSAPAPAPVSGPPGEVFLSYHSPDRAALLEIRELLATRGITTFLDRDNLVAGMPWPQALEGALGQARSATRSTARCARSRRAARSR